MTDDNEWDSFVLKSNDGWLYQTSSAIKWQNNESKNRVNLSFIVRRLDRTPVAIVPLFLIIEPLEIQKYKVPNLLVSTINYFYYKKFRRYLIGKKYLKFDPESFSGPVFLNGISKKNKAKISKIIYERIDFFAKKYSASEFIARLCEASISFHPKNRPDINPLFFMGVGTQCYKAPRATAYIDLSQNNEDTWKQLDEDCRSSINKAKRMGITFIENDRKNIARYHLIHAISWNRTMGHHQPLTRFQAMIRHLDLNDSVHIFFAQKNGVDVSAVVLHTFKDTGFYMGGASTEEAYSLGANNLLLYESVLWCQLKGLSTFVVGIYDTNDGNGMKSFNVGKYKSQFSNIHRPTLESKKIY